MPKVNERKLLSSSSESSSFGQESVVSKKFVENPAEDIPKTSLERERLVGHPKNYHCPIHYTWTIIPPQNNIIMAPASSERNYSHPPYPTHAPPIMHQYNPVPGAVGGFSNPWLASNFSAGVVDGRAVSASAQFGVPSLPEILQSLSGGQTPHLPGAAGGTSVDPPSFVPTPYGVGSSRSMMDPMLQGAVHGGPSHSSNGGPWYGGTNNGSVAFGADGAVHTGDFLPLGPPLSSSSAALGYAVDATNHLRSRMHEDAGAFLNHPGGGGGGGAAVFSEMLNQQSAPYQHHTTQPAQELLQAAAPGAQQERGGGLEELRRSERAGSAPGGAVIQQERRLSGDEQGRRVCRSVELFPATLPETGPSAFWPKERHSEKGVDPSDKEMISKLVARLSDQEKQLQAVQKENKELRARRGTSPPARTGEGTAPPTSCESSSCEKKKELHPDFQNASTSKLSASSTISPMRHKCGMGLLERACEEAKRKKLLSSAQHQVSSNGKRIEALENDFQNGLLEGAFADGRACASQSAVPSSNSVENPFPLHAPSTTPSIPRASGRGTPFKTPPWGDVEDDDNLYEFAPNVNQYSDDDTPTPTGSSSACERQKNSSPTPPLQQVLVPSSPEKAGDSSWRNAFGGFVRNAFGFGGMCFASADSRRQEPHPMDERTTSGHEDSEGSSALCRNNDLGGDSTISPVGTSTGSSSPGECGPPTGRSSSPDVVWGSSDETCYAQRGGNGTVPVPQRACGTGWGPVSLGREDKVVNEFLGWDLHVDELGQCDAPTSWEGILIIFQRVGTIETSSA